MEEAKGKINRIFQNKTQGGKRYWVLSVQDEGGELIRYSVWDWKMLEGVNEGDSVHFRYDTKNGYNNVSAILKTERATGYPSGALSDEYEAIRSEQIARMSAIKSATQLLSSYQGDPLDKIAKTLEAAEKFQKYIFGPLEPDEKDGDQQPEVKGKRKSKKEKTSAPTVTSGGKETPGQVPPVASDLPF